MKKALAVILVIFVSMSVFAQGNKASAAKTGGLLDGNVSIKAKVFGNYGLLLSPDYQPSIAGATVVKGGLGITVQATAKLTGDIDIGAEWATLPLYEEKTTVLGVTTTAGIAAYPVMVFGQYNLAKDGSLYALLGAGMVSNFAYVTLAGLPVGASVSSLGIVGGAGTNLGPVELQVKVYYITAGAGMANSHLLVSPQAGITF